MIGFLLIFLVAGLVITWVFGIKPELEKSVNNEKTIERYYFDKSNN